MRTNSVTLVLGFGVFGVICTEFGVIGMLPQIAEFFEVEIETTGLLISLFSTVVAVSGLFITLITSKFNKRHVLLFSLIVFIVSNILSALATSFEWLLFARILPAFLVPVYFSTALVTATESAKRLNSTQTVAAIYTGISVATVLGIPIINYLADTLSWRYSFWFTAAVNALAWVCIFMVVPSIPPNRKISVSHQLKVLKHPPLWGSMIGVCCLAAGSFSMYSYFAEYLLKVFHMTASQLSLMLMLFGLTGVVGNWVVGITLSKNFENTLLFFISGIGLTMLLMKFMGIHFELQVIFIAIWGFLHAAGFVISQIWVGRESTEAPAFGNSLVISTANLGAALGTSLGGMVIDQYGIRQLIWVALFLFLLTLIIFRMMKSLFSRRNASKRLKQFLIPVQYKPKSKDCSTRECRFNQR